MHTSLVINPLASVDVMGENDDLVSGGPVPGRGMRFLTISKADQPRLHSLFRPLCNAGLGQLDVEDDLMEDDRALLAEYGILVSPDNVPERPLFSCMLDDVDGANLESGPLTVNPSLEFEPFDLLKFRTWMQDRHLSPHHATAWVRDPETDIKWGYWLTTGQADVVKGLEPGSPVAAQMDPSFTGKLVSARILLDSSAVQPRRDILAAADKFRNDRYAIVDNVVPPAQLRALQNYYRQYVDQGFMKFGDSQVPGRFAEHGEHVASMVHNGFTPLMSRLVGAEIEPTYSYSAVYTEGADLEPHTDRDACEFSFSVQIDFSPEQQNGVSPWPLYLAHNSPDDLAVDPSTDTAVRLANGSCLAYKGRELVHYRTPLPAGNRSTSIFFHYIPA